MGYLNRSRELFKATDLTLTQQIAANNQIVDPITLEL